ncbi:MAG: trypsin-like peptidase domain-containing protein [Tepidisphaerales bacterium]
MRQSLRGVGRPGVSRIGTLLVLLAGGGLVGGGCAARPADPFPDASPRNVVRVTERVFPAVVRLDVAQETFDQGRRNLRRGIGSGVIIDDDGHILTNFHVAGRAAEIFVTLYNKERVRATLVGDDHWTDLAVVRLDMDEVRRRGISFRAAELGDSDKLMVGQPVMAIGTPFGLARTTTLGVVSNNERTFYPENQTIDEFETGIFSNWIQMDAPIAPGNSGGPLVDLAGNVVGINTRGIPGAGGLNFAIPINTAKGVIDQILATATPDRKGRVTRADLGIDLKPMQDLESFFEVDVNQGVLVNSVDRRSPAEKAGIQPQDVLLSINGRPINVRFPEELAAARQFIAELPIGQEVTLVVRRGRQNLTFTAVTERLEGVVGEEREFRVWGITVRDVTRPFANANQLDDDRGVVITSLANGLPGQKAELQRRDVIRAVNGEPVDNLDSFIRLYERSVAAQEPTVLIEFQRGRAVQRAVLRPTYDGPAR